ncbi:MAG: hypothetical protein ACYTFV_17840 [Planctomycetota bacterium]
MKQPRPTLSRALLPLFFACAWCAPGSAAGVGDAGPESPSSFASPARPSRAAVADALELRVAGSSQLDPAARLGALIAAAESAAGQLAGQRAGDLLAARVRTARWEGLGDRKAASAGLREDLTRWVSDLRFRPIMEAELPPGFPELPTPIHEIEVRSYPGYRMAQASMGGRVHRYGRCGRGARRARCPGAVHRRARQRQPELDRRRGRRIARLASRAPRVAGGRALPDFRIQLPGRAGPEALLRSAGARQIIRTPLSWRK